MNYFFSYTFVCLRTRRLLLYVMRVTVHIVYSVTAPKGPHTLPMFFSTQCPHTSLMDFLVSPPGCGRSVTDFWSWEAVTFLVIYEYEVPLTTQTMFTMDIFPFKEKPAWQNRESNSMPHDQ
jgi:hypothetical protein